MRTRSRTAEAAITRRARRAETSTKARDDAPPRAGPAAAPESEEPRGALALRSRALSATAHPPSLGYWNVHYSHINIILVKEQRLARPISCRRAPDLSNGVARALRPRNLRPAVTFLSYHGEVSKIARLKAASRCPSRPARRPPPAIRPTIQQEGRHPWSLASTWRRNPALM